MLGELHLARQARQPAITTVHRLRGGAEVFVVEKHGEHLGSSLWDSALPLAEWCRGRQLWGEKASWRVLEVGAGCGSASIAAALNSGGRVASVVLTDKADVLPHVERNLVANREGLARAGVVATALPLDWVASSPSEWESALAGGPFDLVLAADCVYELPLLDALVGVALRALAPEGKFIVGSCRRGGRRCPPAEVDARLAAAFAVAAKDVVRLREAAAGDAAGGTDTSTMAVFELTRRSM